MIRSSQLSMSQTIIRLYFDCLLQILEAFSQQIFFALINSLVKELKAFQICFMSFRVDGPGTRQEALLLRRQFDPDLSRNCSPDLALQRKNVAQIALVAFCP